MKKILITGSSGFIGRNLKEFLRSQYEVLAPTSKQLNLLDELKVKKYLTKHTVDTVIHCATHNGTVVSSKDLALVFKNNVMMFMNLAKHHHLYKRMFYFGSGAEYDMRHYVPHMKEGYFDTHIPVDDYGFSKYIMAQHIKNIPNIIDLRLFGVYGKYEDYRIRFISQTICRALIDQHITINQNVRFDYLYINDLVKIIVRLIEIKNLPHQYYNVCTGSVVDLRSLAKLVVKIAGKKLTIKTKKKGLKKEYSGNNKQLLNTIGKFPFTSHETAVKELYEWYKGNDKIAHTL